MKKIPLTQNQKAFVDDEDYDFIIEGHKWFAHKRGGIFYATRRTGIGDKKEHMHTVIWEQHNGVLPTGYIIDHRNHIGTDNRKENLRLASKSQNSQNRRFVQDVSSEFKGVSFHSNTGKWGAYIKKNQKLKWLGLYDNEIDAARAYDQAARKSFGEYAFLNFPNENISPPQKPPKFFDGKPCHKGHGTKRYRSTGACVECIRGYYQRSKLNE